jgi:hypothetical protein
MIMSIDDDIKERDMYDNNPDSPHYGELIGIADIVAEIEAEKKKYEKLKRRKLFRSLNNEH